MHITVSYRVIPNGYGWAWGDSMVRAFKKLGHECIPFAREYKTGIPIAPVPHDTDLVLMLECNDEDPKYD
jgi:hypothetical protein